MKLTRHRIWHWILLGTRYDAIVATTAFVMDDFGNAAPIKYAVSRITMREGDA
jgi:hypothetical protein